MSRASTRGGARQALWGLVLSAGLAGCSSFGPPGPDARATEPPPSSQGAPAGWLQAADPAPGTAAATPPAWWSALADPTLDALVDEALRSAPEGRLAQARLREARARRDATVAGQSPSLSLGGSASRSQSDGAGGRNSFDVGFDAAWEADIFGRVRAGVEASDADLAVAQANLADARRSLAAEVARAYLNLRAQQARLGVARDNLASQSDTAQIARWRAQAGLVSQLDVVQAEASLAQTRSQLAGLQGGLASAQNQLALLVGLPLQALQARWPALVPAAVATALAAPAPAAAGAVAASQANSDAADSLPEPPPGTPLQLPAEVLRQRPDVRAAEAQWRAEAARSRQADRARLPSLRLTGQIGLQALTLGALGQGGYGALAAALTAPLFDGGALQAQLAAQVATQDRAAISYQQTVLTALSEVEDALASLATGRQRVQALVQAAQASRQAAALTRLRYRSGLVDFRSVLEAERSLLSSEDGLASARADTLAAWVALHKALGAEPPPLPATASASMPEAIPEAPAVSTASTRP